MTLTPPRIHHSHDLRNAWIALALFPVAYLVAALVGGAILAGLGYAEQEPVPLGTALAVGLPLVVLLALPAAIGCWLGLRARRAGRGRPRQRAGRARRCAGGLHAADDPRRPGGQMSRGTPYAG